MRAPTPVVVNTCSGRSWPALQAALFGLTAGALVAWVGLHLELADGTVWVATGSAGAVAGGVGFWLVRPVQLALGWSGASWFLDPAAGASVPVARPAVMLDLGGWMLLRVRAGDRTVWWIPVSHRAAGVQWPPFRAAVYSSASGLPPRSPAERTPF